MSAITCQLRPDNTLKLTLDRSSHLLPQVVVPVKRSLA
jgi:hypothetical protein